MLGCAGDSTAIGAGVTSQGEAEWWFGVKWVGERKWLMREVLRWEYSDAVLQQLMGVQKTLENRQMGENIQGC